MAADTANCEITRRVLLPHDAFDVRSAQARGPVIAGKRRTCAGTVELLGEEDDPVLLARCARCGFETGIRRIDVEALSLPVDAAARWWWR